MFLNNSFNILPWYDSLEKQSSKKWYAFGQSWPLLCPKGAILPFQFVCEALEVTSNIQAVNVNTNEITDLGVAPSVIQGSQPNSTYYVVKLASAAVPALPVGTYYLRFNTSLGYLYSEEITIIDDSSECIKIQYWNEDTLNFASGEINFADNFKFEFYIRSTIGKPEYEFEEELTKRLGYKFIESQTSNKVYKFAFVAPEYICDAMRLIRLCDYVKLTTKFDSYNALSFAYEPKWQDQGDLAAVDVEFDTDCIIQKLESFNRRIKESFYNALLADIDEPVLFSTDTVAQYYTEFTTTSFINGKLIRQLELILPDELQSNFVDLVLPIDNMADDKNTAKKVSLPDLMSLVNSSDISKLFKGHFDADGNLQWIEALSHIGVNGGVTMFIDNGTMSLPQLYAGLPIDNSTLIRDDNGVLMINPDIDLGGGLTEVYWNDIKSKPTFATVATSGKYADLGGLPDLSVYATTEYLTAELKKYVTLNTEQTIAAHKNFLNGLSVGGLGITKSQDDVVYIDANLVVRGGITMFGTNSVDVPTIMDAIATDGTNLKVVNGVLTFVGSIDGGEAGSVAWENVTGKPSFASVATSGKYSDLSGTPTLLSSFTDDVVAGKYLPLSGGKLSTKSNIVLTLDASTMGDQNYLQFYNVYYSLGCLGFSAKDNPVYRTSSGTNYKLWHAGNFNPSDYLLASKYTASDILAKLKTVDGEGSGLDADLLDGIESKNFIYQSVVTITSADDLINQNQGHLTGGLFGAKAKGWNNIAGLEDVSLGYVLMYGQNSYTSTSAFAGGGLLIPAYGEKAFLLETSGAGGSINIIPHRILTDNIIGNYNAGSATKLQTARTIWGQSFDGSGDVSGTLTLGYNSIIGGGDEPILGQSTIGYILLGLGTSQKGFDTYIDGYNTRFRYGTAHTEGMRLTSSGNVLIGTTTDSGYKLNVNGVVRTNTKVRIEREGASNTYLEISMNDVQANYKAYDPDGYANHVFYSNGTARLVVNGQSGNVGIGIIGFYPSYKLDVVGDIRSTTNVRTPIATIDGISIYKSQDDVLYINGNLAVRGGITMYATDAIDVPSIIDSIPTASTSAKGLASFDPNFFSVDDNGNVSFIGSTGITEVNWTDVVGRPTLLSSFTNDQGFASSLGELSNVGSWADSAPTQGRLLYQEAGSSGWSYKNVSEFVSETGAYLPLSGGTLSGLLRIDFLNSTDNISSAVGLHVLRSVAASDEWGASIALTAYQGKGSVIMSGGYGGNITYYNGYSYLDRASLRWDNKGNLFVPNVMFEKGGSVAEQYKCGMYMWDNILQITKRQLDLTYIKEMMTIDLPNERIKCHVITEFTDYIQTDGRYAYIASSSFNSVAASGGWAAGHILRKSDRSTIGFSCGGFGTGDNFSYYFYGGDYDAHAMRLIGNNMLVTGGITMYSDIRKKTKLQDVELSLSQIANAPLIEHYYNSDDKRTTHVGSIAQYWAGLNDWFCKPDNEGFYTMEIQNAALASAISIARELAKYESKTDKEIRLLKDEVKRLKKEIKILKSA